jgi:glycosyltransferase involved in cell wall biosynthesis
MRIGLVAPFDEPVPPPTYGGAERVIANLAQEWVGAGHEIYLLASADSTAPGHLIPILEGSVRAKQGAHNRRARYQRRAIAEIVHALQHSQLDIIHNHLGWQLLPYASLLDIPVVTTLHGPLNVPLQQAYYSLFADANYVSISHNQRCGMPGLNYIANIYNGIDVGSFSIGNQPRSYLAFLGRISPEKGIVEAIQIARAAGLPLQIAAKIDPVDMAFFRRKVAPLIDGEQVRYIGEVDQMQKVAFLQQALALLMPIQWEEPFGLVSIEAMACGAPVIGLSRGALPEIIQDRVNGFLCRNNAEMVAAARRTPDISSERCRQTVMQKFSARRMAQRYLRTFERVLAAR